MYLFPVCVFKSSQLSESTIVSAAFYLLHRTLIPDRSDTELAVDSCPIVPQIGYAKKPLSEVDSDGKPKRRRPGDGETLEAAQERRREKKLNKKQARPHISFTKYVFFGCDSAAVYFVNTFHTQAIRYL
jgi:hypothetical protein